MSHHEAIDVAAAVPLAPPLPGWPRLLSAEMASSYLCISERNFLDRVKQHMLPASVKIGERVLWDRLVLDRFVDALVGFDAPSAEIETDEGWKWQP